MALKTPTRPSSPSGVPPVLSSFKPLFIDISFEKAIYYTSIFTKGKKLTSFGSADTPVTSASNNLRTLTPISSLSLPRILAESVCIKALANLVRRHSK